MGMTVGMMRWRNEVVGEQILALYFLHVDVVFSLASYIICLKTSRRNACT